ncbi:hypothetical protein GQX73_g7180 [Xylaria multiplex]|uniref:SET domain-containing protein n=1 Tax=Xylaria multiplex TaxID=323545 RepID=A0A7C8IPJ6_9PEZI|nr:hypothetical protein GQX73_g7180 [Xylaria multiplex]
MSDISLSEDYEWPFEVRPADDKGMGAFATRDIKPGEIVLVDFTTIILGGDDLVEQAWNLVKIYEALSPEEQEQWGSLAATSSEGQRRASIVGWGFACDCPKCNGGADTYTASLENARDAANGIEQDENRPLPVFGDTTEEIGQRINNQINILREIYQKKGPEDEDKSIHKELVFALMEGADYERLQWITFLKAGNPEEGEKHLKPYVDFVFEGKAIAEAVWPITHEILQYIRVDEIKARLRWNNKDAIAMSYQGGTGQ